ncbi:hypothetical protein SVAN01_01489 [Stagonosporopsis vannaccii]|nr:hypothetical protein SVAN01_01489 [Stagonosporopsis vannaccii]
MPEQADQTESGHLSTPGAVLIASLSSFLCWVLTGVIGYNSPPLPIKDDFTIMALFLWIPQAVASFYLVYKAGERGWSTPAAALSAVIIGIAAAVAWGVCWAQWSNVATRVFWAVASVYVALGVEAWVGIAEGAERRIARLLGE